jgi:O-antigen/teichoic acid export membrane protein
VFIAGSILGPAGLGGLKAAQTIVTGPALVLIQAGGSIGLPEASRALAERGWPGLKRVATVVTGAGLLIVGACAGVVGLAGSSILSDVYGPQFAHLYLAAMLIGIGQIVSSFSLGPILVLKSTRRSRYLFLVQLATLVTSLGSVALLSLLYGVDGAAGASIAVSAASVTGFRWYQHKVSAATENRVSGTRSMPLEGAAGELTGRPA